MALTTAQIVANAKATLAKSKELTDRISSEGVTSGATGEVLQAPAQTIQPIQPTYQQPSAQSGPYQYTNPITGQQETAPNKEWYDQNKGLLFPGTSSYTGVSTGTTPQTTITGQPSQIPITPDAKDLAVNDYTTPTLDTGSTVDVQAFTNGLTAEVDKYRTQLENLYTKQLADLKTKQDTSQKKIDELTAKEEDLITGDIKDLLQPYREALEKSERERLKVEENYFNNQKSIGELESLLTQGQADIEAAEAVTGLASIRSPRIAKVKQDIAARAGIIQAVMSARNGQISVATNLIDRTANAIASDRNGELKYYESLLNLYESQRGEEVTKLFNLTKEQKAYVNAQINLIQNDLNNAQATYDYIKQMMVDPNTANMIEQAGITLNDTMPQIQQKMSQYTYTQEVVDNNNSMELNGFQFITEAQANSKPANEVSVITDSRGNKKYWWKQGGTTSEFTKSQLLKLEQAGINPNTDRQGALNYLYGDGDAPTDREPFSPFQLQAIADQFIATNGKDKSLKYLAENNTIPSGGKTITLSESEKQQLIQMLGGSPTQTGTPPPTGTTSGTSGETWVQKIGKTLLNLLPFN